MTHEIIWLSLLVLFAVGAVLHAISAFRSYDYLGGARQRRLDEAARLRKVLAKGKKV